MEGFVGDYYQNGIITCFHNLTHRPVEALEADLVRFAPKRPMALILPSLFSELEGEALPHIVDELAKVPYLEEIVIGLDGADADQFAHARQFFSRLPQRHRIMWHDGPRLTALTDALANEDLAPAHPGKGRNVWYCFGYVAASGRAASVALHDCDILTYDRQMLARLIYPVANPNFNYLFCKGYYARVAEKQMTGRVSRLLVTPLIKALKKICQVQGFLDYLNSYRFPLSGEFSMRTDVCSNIRIPSDWGLEIGVLSEVQRSYSTNRLCQADIAEIYDHKHQPLSKDDPGAGLNKMSIDIAKAIFRKLAIDGQVLSMETFRTIKATYYRTALDFIERYYHDALMNGLLIDRHAEEQTVELFAANIVEAGNQFLDNPMEAPFLPNWNRVDSAIPDFLERLLTAVEEDNQGP
jgi:glucosyl-3-phosphoglycerate synthase